MTSTLGGWILTGYGAAKAPRLMQFSVHCDHLRSVLFVRAGPSPYGEMVAALTTLFRKKMCASIYVHGRGRNFMVCQLFSPYGEKEAVLFGCFQKHFSNIRPRKRAKVRRFSKKILKTDLLPCGETWAVLSGCFSIYGEKHAVLIRCFPKTFSASSTIRRNACPFVNVFPRKDLLP